MVPLVSTLVRALAVSCGALFFAGCFGVTDLDNDEPCKNVGYAIASRTLDCTSDVDLANARHRRFTAATKCAVEEPGEEAAFTCAISVNAATCDEVREYGDDIDAWLGRTSACANILRRADGSPLPVRMTGSSDIGDNPVCQRIADAAADRRFACAPDEVDDPTTRHTTARAELDTTHQCTVTWPEDAEPPTADADACVAAIADLVCDDVAAEDIADIVARAPPCAALVVVR